MQAGLHLDVGKRAQAGAIGSCSGLIPTLSCSESGVEFALDTGAAISILPLSYGYTGPPSTTAETANGGQLSLVGSRRLNFSLQGISYSHKFEVGDVTSPIIGCDFLEMYDLGVHLTPPPPAFLGGNQASLFSFSSTVRCAKYFSTADEAAELRPSAMQPSRQQCARVLWAANTEVHVSCPRESHFGRSERVSRCFFYYLFYPEA